MGEHKVFQMSFAKIYDLLLNKAVKKGRTQAEVDEVVWSVCVRAASPTVISSGRHPSPTRTGN